MLARASSSQKSSERLTERRRTRRRFHRIALFILFLLLLALAIYGLRQPSVRISHIQVYGGDSDLMRYATDAMHGTYLGLIPRDSFFFIPEERVRSSILADHPEYAAVSIQRTGFTGVSVAVIGRTAIARWCGVTSLTGSVQQVQEKCYVFDPNGFIFAPVASTTEVRNSFLVYAPLVSELSEPIRGTLTDAEKLPTTFDFARRVGTFGASVATIEINEGEVNYYLDNGTRITYLLGQEQQAMTALVSAGSNTDLSDGSLDYVDLRFDGKVYLKRK